MADPHDEIVDLEAKIDALSEAAIRCRTIIRVAKVVVGAGIILLATAILGLIRSDPVLFVGAITAILGGIALSGSSRSTHDELVIEIRQHEARRAEMIDGLALPEVDGNRVR